jgi:aminopeptidase N
MPTTISRRPAPRSRGARNAFRTAVAALASLAAFAAFAPAARADDEPAVRDLDASELIRLHDEAAFLLGTSGHAPAEGKPVSIDAERAGEMSLALTGFDVLHYRLDVTPSRTNRNISGTVTITLVVLGAGLTQIDLNSRVTIDAITVEGTPRTGWTQGGGALHIPICEAANCPPHAPGDTLEVAVTYHATPATLGFYYYVRNSYTFTEPFDSPYWYVCRDDPSDKATLDVYATVPDTNSCYSNGVLVDVTPAGAGKSTWHWQETHPIATYLVSIAVYKSWELHQTHGTVPILSAVFPEDSTKAKADFLNVPAMVGVFEGRWAPYPFDKVGQAFVTNFPAGGMEHQSMTTFNRSLVTGTRANEIVWAHELAHQWWGDWVTLATWPNIWLNEGFASYGEAEWMEDFYGPAAYASTISSQMTSALNMDANFRHPVYNPPTNQMFSQTIYKKGSLLLHMLRRILGDGPFFAGMQLYGSRFAYGNATSADFQTAMEDASGQDLDWYFNPWLYGQGLPTYQWSWTNQPLDGGSSNLAIFIRQVQVNSPLYRMPIELKVSRASLPDTTVFVWNEALPEQQIVVPMAGTAIAVTFDPRNSILKRVQEVVSADGGGEVADGGVPRIAVRAAPNPARGTVALTVARGAGSNVRETFGLRVYDAAGRFVRDLGDGARALASGESTVVRWDRRDARGARVAAGVYFVDVSLGPLHETRPVVLID